MSLAGSDDSMAYITMSSIPVSTGTCAITGRPDDTTVATLMRETSFKVVLALMAPILS
jgi:hypothetical protein